MNLKRLFSVILAFAMIIGTMGFTAMAADTVAKIGETGFSTFDEAIVAANAMTGDVTVEIYAKVEYTDATASLTGAYDSINFVGKDAAAEISITRNGSNGYISGVSNDCKVTFTDLLLSKPAGYYANDAGYMNMAFTVYRVGSVDYINCQFPNGACAAGCPTTYTGCTFEKSHEKYALWAYGAEVAVDECTFDDDRGIKMYAEGAAKTTALTVTDTDFSKLTGKPAIVATLGQSITLSGNTYSAKGVLELEDNGSSNGIKITSDDTVTCISDAYPDGCGVLVDGAIYRNVTEAAAVATSGSTVILMYNTTESATFADGVTFNANGYTAENVTVPTPAYVAKVGETYYTTLTEAIADATEGDTVTIFAGEYKGDLNVNKAGITVSGQTDADGKNLVTINGKLSISGSNITVNNLDVNNSSSTAGSISGSNIVVNGCSVVGGNGFRYCYAKGLVTFKNSTITGSTYGIHFDGSTGGDIVIDNCVITGWTSFASTIGSVTIKDTKFEEGNYNVLRFYQNASVENCEFNPESRIDSGNSGAGMEGITLEFADCTVSDGSDFAERIASGTVSKSEVSVDGVKIEAPSVISTVAELQAFAEAVNAGNSYEGKTVKLANDIDLEYSAVVIGTYANPFKGTFDGQGYTISNLYIYENGSESDYFADSDDYLGLFGVINTPAVIKNVTVADPFIVGCAYVGGIVGCAYTGAIENCHVTGEIDIEGNYMVGGITGQGYASIKDCSVIGAAGWDFNYIGATYLEADLEGDKVGGIVGHKAETSTIAGCRVENVTVEGTRSVGGVAGLAFMNSKIMNNAVKNVTVRTTSTTDYADSNTGKMGIGGVVGVYEAYAASNGMFAENTVENLTLENENSANVSMGLLTGGFRNRSTSPNTIGELADTMTVAANNITGTNTGATNEFANNSDGEFVSEWNYATDSGLYGDKSVAVMRFLFALSITESIDVEKSGIKYIAGNDISAEVKGESGSGAEKAFYGDITGVPTSEAGNTYYAVAYITTETGKTYWSNPLGCTVNVEKFFSEYTGGNN